MEPHTLSQSPPMIYYAYTMPTPDNRTSLVVILEGFHSADEAQAWLHEVMADYEDGVGHPATPPKGVLH